MTRAPIPTTEILTLLRENPARMAELTAGHAPSRLRTPPEPEAWSSLEILAHLRACADVWGASIDRILREENPRFAWVSPRSWIRKTGYDSQDFAVSFAAYRTQRGCLVSRLQSLSPADWKRAATVKASTAVRQETVLSYARRLAGHEAGHCGQIERVVDAHRHG